VTSFFRDTPAWEFVEKQVVPVMLASKGPHAPVRVWSAGCASGQEAYSIAILLADALGDAAFRERVKVYATDADEEALTQARHATYAPKDMETLPPAAARALFRAGERALRVPQRPAPLGDLRAATTWCRTRRSRAWTCSSAATRSCISTPRRRPR
jgi:chemotaxis methyl-accepting protein methylase